ncbi:hypothetical protein ACHAW6_006153 [Cyclotella cf. meneghiniana]
MTGSSAFTLRSTHYFFATEESPHPRNSSSSYSLLSLSCNFVPLLPCLAIACTIEEFIYREDIAKIVHSHRPNFLTKSSFTLLAVYRDRHPSIMSKSEQRCRRRQRTTQMNYLSLTVAFLALVYSPQSSTAFRCPPSLQLSTMLRSEAFSLDGSRAERESGSSSTNRKVRRVKMSTFGDRSYTSSNAVLLPARISPRKQMISSKSTQIQHHSSITSLEKSQRTKSSKSFQRLTHEEEMALLRTMRSSSTDTHESQAARQTLLLHNLPLVQSIVSKTMSSHPRLLIQGTDLQLGAALSRDDLINEGMIGLAEALDKYDFMYSDLNTDNRSSPQGARLGTYATYWIRARIMRAIQSREHVFRFPERTLQASHRLVKAARVLDLEWSAVVELKDADSAEKKQLRSKLCHVAGITSDILFREAIRVRSMSSPTTTTHLESWMFSAPSSESLHLQQLEVNENPDTGFQHIHDTLSKFLMPREVQVLSLRYGLLCSEETSSSKPVVFRDYQAEAEEDLFGPNGILPHYSDVPIEQRIPTSQDHVTSTNYAVRELSPVTATGSSMEINIQTEPTLKTTASSQYINNLSTSSALLPFKEVGKRMKFSGEYCRRLCTEALRKLTKAAEEGRLAESDFLMGW